MTGKVARLAGVALLAVVCAQAPAAELGIPGGAEPANIAEISGFLRRDAYDLELLISFGTSKGGSAGHLALAIREPGDDFVYSANFYADRASEHEKDYYIDELMLRIPKMEYLYRTTSTLSGKASFGLDFGEVYKRSVIGIRVYGVPPSEKANLTAFFARMNEDFRNHATRTAYHDREVKYDYVHLNCAKTIGSGFKYGAGYKDLDVSEPRILPGRTNLVAALTANIPTEMAMKLVKEWSARGYAMDAVLYKKYPGSPYVDSLEEEKVAFRDLPNRFPSVLSRDFRRDQGKYEDYDNLYAMYLLFNMGRYSVHLDGDTGRLRIEGAKNPMKYAQAAKLAEDSAHADSAGFLERLVFQPRGTTIEDAAGGTAGAAR